MYCSEGMSPPAPHRDPDLIHQPFGCEPLVLVRKGVASMMTDPPPALEITAEQEATAFVELLGDLVRLQRYEDGAEARKRRFSDGERDRIVTDEKTRPRSIYRILTYSCRSRREASSGQFAERTLRKPKPPHEKTGLAERTRAGADAAGSQNKPKLLGEAAVRQNEPKPSRERTSSRYDCSAKRTQAAA